ncbi:hypothetical protein EI94DRAFT_1742413, partial [Lactarius quietus]
MSIVWFAFFPAVIVYQRVDESIRSPYSQTSTSLPHEPDSFFTRCALPSPISSTSQSFMTTRRMISESGRFVTFSRIFLALIVRLTCPMSLSDHEPPHL